MPNGVSEYDKRREQIAALVHRVWAEWWTFQRRFCIEQDDGWLAIDEDKVKRWDRQASADYQDLPLSERKSDQQIADRYIELFGSILLELNDKIDVLEGELKECRILYEKALENACTEHDGTCGCQKEM